MEYHIINLDSEKKNYENVKQSLKEIGVDDHRINRFSAISGKDKRKELRREYGPHVDVLADNVIGIQASHVKLAQKLLKKADKDSIFIILEDDAYPNVKSENDYLNIIEKTKHDWEILRLKMFCVHTCSTSKLSEPLRVVNPPLLNICAAAYVINYKGLKKIAGFKTLFHADLMQSYFLDSKILNRNVFKCDESTSHTQGRHEKLKGESNEGRGEWSTEQLLNVKTFRIPYIGYDLNTGECLCIFMIIIYISYMLLKRHKTARVDNN